MFVAKDFVLKHIRLKQAHMVEAEREKVRGCPSLDLIHIILN